MTRFTNEQVQAQQKQFDCFITKVNLPKLGKKLVGMTDYHFYNFTGRVLSRNKIQMSMYHPVKNRFYGDILQGEAIIAYIKTLS